LRSLPESAIPEGHPPSPAQHASCWQPSPSPHSTFRTHSLQPHYRTFTTTTGRSAPAPRGTLPLTVSAARGPPSRSQAALPDRQSRGVQVLLFHASACDELTPPSHRAPPGQRAGCLLTTAPPIRRSVVPGWPSDPGFDAITKLFDASSVVHSRSSSRRVPDPLTAGLFRSRFPPRLLTGMTPRRFGLSACTANPEDLPPSLAQHGPW